MNDAFKQWVVQWQIGPGMNDEWRRQRREAQGMAPTAEPMLYSGGDGWVGPGWVPMLHRLAEDLKRMGWDGSVDQIKEKFGTLRFYARPAGVADADKPMFMSRIQQAELESAVTCEDCGAPGTPGPRPGRHWIKVLCATCRATPQEVR